MTVTPLLLRAAAHNSAIRIRAPAADFKPAAGLVWIRPGSIRAREADAPWEQSFRFGGIGARLGLKHCASAGVPPGAQAGRVEATGKFAPASSRNSTAMDAIQNPFAPFLNSARKPTRVNRKS